jgi:hypothetical protein
MKHYFIDSITYNSLPLNDDNDNIEEIKNNLNAMAPTETIIYVDIVGNDLFSLELFINNLNNFTKNINLGINNYNILEKDEKLLDCIMCFDKVSINQLLDNVILLKYCFEKNVNIFTILNLEINESDIFEFYKIMEIKHPYLEMIKMMNDQYEINELKKMFINDVVIDNQFHLKNDIIISVCNNIEKIKLFGSSINFWRITRGLGVLNFAR